LDSRTDSVADGIGAGLGLSDSFRDFFGLYEYGVVDEVISAGFTCKLAATTSKTFELLASRENGFEGLSFSFRAVFFQARNRI
jgi:hypothetical protein